MTFNVPKWSEIPVQSLVVAGASYLYSLAFKTDSLQTIKAFVIWQVANDVFQKLADLAISNRTVSGTLITMTTGIIDTVAIMALRQLKIIGTTGTVLLGLLTFARFVNRLEIVTGETAARRV
ncbi:hypothetical protein [Candidatus Protochlamydia phocaeensis]|uniref:hypothetical protein n=1 Tax=Candidatus Protochlamydia phocaeensis TaxID=1414722 RepID=UPI000839287A|nr:hypothetical protein [Candidatus Protochlamydia phocaeensis]